MGVHRAVGCYATTWNECVISQRSQCSQGMWTLSEIQCGHIQCFLEFWFGTTECVRDGGRWARRKLRYTEFQQGIFSTRLPVLPQTLCYDSKSISFQTSHENEPTNTLWNLKPWYRWGIYKSHFTANYLEQAMLEQEYSSRNFLSLKYRSFFDSEIDPATGVRTCKSFSQKLWIAKYFFVT